MDKKKRGKRSSKKVVLPGAIVLRPKNPQIRKRLDRKLAQLKRDGKPNASMTGFVCELILKAC